MLVAELATRQLELHVSLSFPLGSLKNDIKLIENSHGRHIIVRANCMLGTAIYNIHLNKSHEQIHFYSLKHSFLSRMEPRIYQSTGLWVKRWV